MTKKEHNNLAQLKGAVKRARNTLQATLQHCWACRKHVALVPHKGLASTYDAARDIHYAVSECNAAIEKLEAILDLPIDEHDLPEVDPFA